MAWYVKNKLMTVCMGPILEPCHVSSYIMVAGNVYFTLSGRRQRVDIPSHKALVVQNRLGVCFFFFW